MYILVSVLSTHRVILNYILNIQAFLLKLSFLEQCQQHNRKRITKPGAVYNSVLS
jgi:hypothetical protein